jgi:hypothetical protein
VVSAIDGPASAAFAPVAFAGNVPFSRLGERADLSEPMQIALERAPGGACVAWGVPFEIGDPIVLAADVVAVTFEPLRARWLVFLHTADVDPAAPSRPTTGEGRLNEHVADYVTVFADGTEARAEIRRRHQVGMFKRRWGEACFQAVAARKPQPVPAWPLRPSANWGQSQVRAVSSDHGDEGAWTNWLWAWENPSPDKDIVGVRFEPIRGVVIVSGLSAGNVEETPIRWQSRRKALLRLPEGTPFDPTLDDRGLLDAVQLDLGQVISAQPRPQYPTAEWAASTVNAIPGRSDREILVEYTAHAEAAFHLQDGSVIALSDVERRRQPTIEPVAPADRQVKIRVLERGTGQPVAARLHLHGEHDEYLAPLDRGRHINTAWFEDYAVDYSHLGQHSATYVDGETVVNLPRGTVYVEVAKGFEFRPARLTVEVAGDTDELTIELDRALTWRSQGWVAADTHVHFLSPITALLQGAAEGVNVTNLLATRWGELVTNAGDFDGRTTWGSSEAGGDGEYLVRVGSENRQHVLGHISLLGYGNRLITPLTAGGPDEAALGDPVSVLLTEWARQCHDQGGVVVIPHFPDPRAEHAASIVAGEVDAIEMTSWEDSYSGIDPYSLADWYRYLNCGYQVAAVGGTDKMSADVAIGTVRTYARLPENVEFSYDAWKDAVRRGETFATYGPLVELFVDGKPMGRRIAMEANGGAVDVTWLAESVTVPMTSVELIVNGEVRERVGVDAWRAAGSWSVRVDRSSWVALLVRGRYPDQAEVIAAHTSAVFIDVEGTEHMAAIDAITILEQIEGAMAYVDTVGTRADHVAHKRMKLVLTSAHRRLHNRLHQAGQVHG